MRLLVALVIGQALMNVPGTAGGGGSAIPRSRIQAAQQPPLQVDARPLGTFPHLWAVPEVPVDLQPPGPWWAPTPEHWEIVIGSGAGQAQLRVYPISAYVRLHASTQPNPVEVEVARLRGLLLSGVTTSEGPLPYLPLINAGQALRAAPRSLAFQGGRGIRYLTAFAQGLSPFLRSEVLYTFQGLTDDGQHYVSFTAPIRPAFLPARFEDVPTADRRAGSGELGVDVFATYRARVTHQLEALTDDPSLTALDAVVRSIRVDLPAPSR